MGTPADITFVNSGNNNKIYADIDDAVKGLYWMLNDMTTMVEPGR